MLTVTYRGTDGAIVTNRVEFGLNAARTALAANESYLRHRQLQRKVREILSARDENGILSAQTQWESLSAAALAGEFPIAAFPAQPGNSNDLFVAFEYALDELGNFDRILRVFRESEVRHRVLQEPGTGPVQVLILKKPFEPESIEARGYRRLAAGGSLVPAPNPIQGEDDVELRVRNSAQADPEKWNVIEFGEPELVRQSALAKFSLISAHLERQRKQVALKRSTFDLIAEPIFLGLNLGGGVTGVPFPIGEAARLGYNALVVPPLIADVPTPKQLRELLLLLAARERHPEIRLRPQRFLSEADLRALKQTASHLTDTQLHEFVERVSDDDLKAMLELAKLQKLDAQVSTLIAIFTSAAKVSGVSESGVLRQIFNSPYFSATGDISLKTLIAVAANRTPTNLGCPDGRQYLFIFSPQSR